MKKTLPLALFTSNHVKQWFYLIIVLALFITSSISGIHRVSASGMVTTCSETALLSAISGGGVITFNLAAPCTITLTSTINLGAGMNLTIDGSGQNIVISGNDAVGLFQVSGATLTLRNLELTRGYAPGGYGAALNVRQGSVITLIQTTLSRNRAGGGIWDYVGGAVGLRSGSSMTVIQSTFTENQISSASDAAAGAIYKDDTSNLIVINSIFTGNRAISNFVGGAGAILSRNGPMVVVNSLFSNNQVVGTNNAFAGAIYIYRGNPTILNSTFVDNTVQNTGIGSAYGGAVGNFVGSPTVIGSTFARNHAITNPNSLGAWSQGGAWWNQGGNPTIVNSTFTANSVEGRSGFGGAIEVDGGAPSLQNVTIADNHATGTNNSRGGGIFSRAGNVPGWTLNNSIVANNTATAGQPNCYDTPSGIAGSFNLIYPTRDQCSASAFPVIADPVLGPLASNGGPTQTMALGAGSAAIAAAYANCPATDQRYVSRTGSPTLCDIGAYQTTSNLPQAPVIGKQFVPTSIAPGEVSTLTITLNNPAGNRALSYVAFTDDLPTGLSVGNGSISNSCGAGNTVIALPGQPTIGIYEINLGVGTTCSITIPVTGMLPGTYANAITSIFAAELGTSPINATGSLTIVGPAPEINVQGSGSDIASGDTVPQVSNGTDFGTTTVGTPTLSHTFTIQNLGNANLNITGLVTVSAGFSVTQPVLTTIPGSGSTTFTVTCDGTSAGTGSGNISIPNNDSDENPYTFAITCLVNGGTPPSGAMPQILVFDPALGKSGTGLGLTGEVVTWNLVATNNGTAAGSDVQVVDTVPSELRIDRVQTSSGTYVISGQTITFSIPTLAPGESVQMQIVTTVLGTPADGQFINSATLTGGGQTRTASAAVLATTHLPDTGYPPATKEKTSFYLRIGLVGFGIALLGISLVVKRKMLLP